jgi:ferredoxin-nitrite reductase
MDRDFSPEQKRYLEGYASGLCIAQTVRSAAAMLGGAPPPTVATPRESPPNPDARMLEAQDRTVAAGGKLVSEEKAKRERHPLDRWEEIVGRAERGEFPKGTGVFCSKYFGLFYVAPAQNAFMCRLRLPNGTISAHQLRGVADISDRLAGGYSHVTTRANLQIREIEAADAPAVVMGLLDLGIINRGAGADNIRNISGSPTAGIDRQELIDTTPLSRSMHHYILNHREMYGLPRKFNIAFDGGGAISVLEDTNDIGFAAVRVEEGKGVDPGIYFRLQLGGTTGHKDFARDSGVMLKPEECVPVAAAVVRVFIDHGDRTDRTKARLKYLIDRWGLEKYLVEMQKYLSFPLGRFPLEQCEPRTPIDRMAHVGVHAQRQEGLSYIGIIPEVGKLTSAQMCGLARIAERYGSGSIRLTVWQSLIVADVPDAQIDAAVRAIEALGLIVAASPVRAGTVACTGNTGCKFSASNTKDTATAIIAHVESHVALDQPINIHITGCHHSCAQHYIGDIGLLACKVPLTDEEEAEGYHVYLGGGYGGDRAIAAEFLHSVPATRVPQCVEKLLRVYLAQREPESEGFAGFIRRVGVDRLHRLIEELEEAA